MACLRARVLSVLCVHGVLTCLECSACFTRLRALRAPWNYVLSVLHKIAFLACFKKSACLACFIKWRT